MDDLYEVSQIADFHRELQENATDLALMEMPRHLETLPGGQEALVIGDPEHCRDFNHPQGDNPFGYRGTCGVVSCEDVLRQFGKDVSETDVLRHAIEDGLCNTAGDDPGSLGGTTLSDQAQILSDFGVPASPTLLGSMESLAAHVQNGQGVIVEVNAGVLWNDASAYQYGEPNHAIVVTGVARDCDTGNVLGFYVNDSGRGLSGDSGRFVDGSLLQSAWLDAGGTCVVTDVVRTEQRNEDYDQ